MEMEIINMYKSKTECVYSRHGEKRMRARSFAYTNAAPASNDICKYAAAAGTRAKSYNILMMFAALRCFSFALCACASLCLEVARAAYCVSSIFFVPLILVFGSSWWPHTRTHTHIFSSLLIYFRFFFSFVRSFRFRSGFWVDWMRIANNKISRWKWYSFLFCISPSLAVLVVLVLEMRMQNEISIKSYLNRLARARSLCVSLVYPIERVLSYFSLNGFRAIRFAWKFCAQNANWFPFTRAHAICALVSDPVDIHILKWGRSRTEFLHLRN